MTDCRSAANMGEMMENEIRLRAEIGRLEAIITRLQGQIDDMCECGNAPIKIGAKIIKGQDVMYIMKGDTYTLTYHPICGSSHELKYAHVDKEPCLMKEVAIYRYGEEKYVGVFLKKKLSPLQNRLVAHD